MLGQGLLFFTVGMFVCLSVSGICFRHTHIILFEFHFFICTFSHVIIGIRSFVGHAEFRIFASF